MIADPPRIPGRSTPKLRSSCDGCGAAKLKCDRGQPGCGRCVSYGIPCVYGVSRKMGKPPRDRRRSTLAPTSCDQPDQQSSQQPDKLGAKYADKTDSSSSSGEGCIVLDMDLGPFSTVSDASACWVTVDDSKNANSLTVDINDAGDGMYSFTPVDFTSLDIAPLDFGEWDQSNDHLLPASLQFGLIPSPIPESPPVSERILPTDSQKSKHGANLFLDDLDLDASLHPSRRPVPPSGISIKGHDCPQEAYEILGSLSFLNVSNSQSTRNDESTSAKQHASRVPLDHVLRLNREASEGLGRIMSCSCAKSPHLALLYASIISRVLIWYLQATGYGWGPSLSPTPMTQDLASHNVSPSDSSPCSGPDSGSGVGSYSWSSTAITTHSSAGGTKGTSGLVQSTGLSVTSTKMAIGTFDVDDLRVQTALKIQLLLGEMRRASNLIDHFITSHSSNDQCLADEPSFGGIDSLYQNLDSWLRGEHLRIANIMRLKLRELNT